MFKRKPKVLTPEQAEEIRTKDFFDMILPGTIKFLSDHYILGDSYRCVWAIREYPPSTEEQAILSQLADRSGVTLRIYHRLVESMEQRKIDRMTVFWTVFCGLFKILSSVFISCLEQKSIQLQIELEFSYSIFGEVCPRYRTRCIRQRMLRVLLLCDTHCGIPVLF